MANRSPEDRLRAEYFDLLPEIRRVTESLEAEVRYHILPVVQKLQPSEQIVIKSRVKECESAVDALRRRQEGSIFDPDQIDKYSLLDLRDLAGVRVLVFPRLRRAEINDALLRQFPGWNRDPFQNDPHETLGYKYSGMLKPASNRVRCEYQIVSMLLGLFWEVEHAAIYKPSPHLKGAIRGLAMQERTQEVVSALAAFEEEFERICHAHSGDVT